MGRVIHVTHAFRSDWIRAICILNVEDVALQLAVSECKWRLFYIIYYFYLCLAVAVWLSITYLKDLLDIILSNCTPPCFSNNEMVVQSRVLHIIRVPTHGSTEQFVRACSRSQPKSVRGLRSAASYPRNVWLGWGETSAAEHFGITRLNEKHRNGRTPTWTSSCRHVRERPCLHGATTHGHVIDLSTACKHVVGQAIIFMYRLSTIN